MRERAVKKGEGGEWFRKKVGRLPDEHVYAWRHVASL